MLRSAALILVVALGATLAGSVATYVLTRPVAPSMPPAASVLQHVREVARLETLDVNLYKKVQFRPDPTAGNGLLSDLWNWARYNVKAPEGRAIVFATAHLGLDLQKLDGSLLRIDGREVWMVLPALQTSIEVNPAETEVIASTLDSQQTAALLGLAKEAMERDVAADAATQQRGRASAERAIRALLVSLGFTKVYFVDQLPAPIAG